MTQRVEAYTFDYPVDMSVKPDVTGFFDPETNTISYVVKDPNFNACAIIDSVMDIDYAAGRISLSLPTGSSNSCRIAASKSSG